MTSICDKSRAYAYVIKDLSKSGCKSLGMSMVSALIMYICEVNREERSL